MRTSQTHSSIFILFGAFNLLNCPFTTIEAPSHKTILVKRKKARMSAKNSQDTKNGDLGPAPLPWSKPFSCSTDLPSGWGTLKSRRSYKCLPAFAIREQQLNEPCFDERTKPETSKPSYCEWGQFVPIAEDENEEQPE